VVGAESRSSASLSVAPSIAPVSIPGAPPLVPPVAPAGASRSSPGMPVAPAVAPLGPPGRSSSPGMAAAPAAQPYSPPTPGLGPTVSMPHFSVSGRSSRPPESVDIPIDELLSRTRARGRCPPRPPRPPPWGGPRGRSRTGACMRLSWTCRRR